MFQVRALSRSCFRQEPHYDAVGKSVPRLRSQRRAECWLSEHVSSRMQQLDLERTIVWEGSQVTYPRDLNLVLELIGFYDLTLEIDTPLILALIAWDQPRVTQYFKHHPLSVAAAAVLHRHLRTPPYPQALDNLVRFISSANLRTPEFGPVAPRPRAPSRPFRRRDGSPRPGR